MYVLLEKVDFRCKWLVYWRNNWPRWFQFPLIHKVSTRNSADFCQILQVESDTDVPGLTQVQGWWWSIFLCDRKTPVVFGAHPQKWLLIVFNSKGNWEPGYFLRENLGWSIKIWPDILGNEGGRWWRREGLFCWVTLWDFLRNLGFYRGNKSDSCAITSKSTLPKTNIFAPENGCLEY